MKAIHRTDVLARGVLASVVMGGMCLMILGYATAGPVVQPANQGASGDRQEGGSLSLSFPSGESWDPGLATPPEQTPSTRQPSRSAAAPGPSSSVAPSTPGQQPTTYQPGYQPGPQGMPLPPTYAPSPGSSSGSLSPYGQMPLPPTAPFDSSSPGGASMGPGMAGPGMGGGRMGMMGRSQQPSGGYTGFGMPSSPTATPSLGGAAMADPSFGRFDTQSISQATAPRQPATFGQSQSQVLRGEKPFADYHQSSPYSPYLRLNSNIGRPGANAYYDWVKPILDQQQQNRQVNREVRGLTDTARAGYQSLESLKQRPGNTIQNTAPRNPGTFMNTGQFYPGLSRPGAR